MTDINTIDAFHRLTAGDWQQYDSFDALLKAGALIQDLDYKPFFRDKDGNVYTIGAVQTACWQARASRRHAGAARRAKSGRAAR